MKYTIHRIHKSFDEITFNNQVAMNLTLKFNYIVKIEQLQLEKISPEAAETRGGNEQFYIENPGSMQTRHKDTQYIEFNQRVHTEYDIKQQFTRIIVIWKHMKIIQKMG